MPRELVVIQVGQCGNQIGTRFWEMALREHAAHNPQGVFDDAMSSFFRNVDARFEPPQEIPLGGRVRDLRARAVVIDMEEGVVNSLLQGPLGDLFDHRSMLTDVSGAGNNWAHGYAMYGPKYHDNLVESVRAAAEHCDSLQSFLVTHSLGGGTGSGVGSYLMGVLEDEFPEVYRFNVAVFPSEDDDVITSPYNSLLSLSKLAEHSDCVFPVENQALMDICAAIDGAGPRLDARRGAALDGQVADAPGTREKPFDRMNGIAASLMLNLTSSVRFKGSLNVDVNEITMNMVPFPRLHFMTASMAPIWAPGGPRAMRQPRGLEQMFTDVLQPKSMLVRSQPKAHTTLACAMLMRGEATISDVNRCMAKVKKEMRMVPWNRDGFKIGLCSKGQVGMPQVSACQPHSVSQLSSRAMDELLACVLCVSRPERARLHAATPAHHHLYPSHGPRSPSCAFRTTRASSRVSAPCATASTSSTPAASTSTTTRSTSSRHRLTARGKT